MKKSDLKDGMCLISKNGATAYVIGEHLYYKDDKCEVGKRLCRIDNLTDYTDDLKARVVEEYDIVKITYMGQILWEIKEYVTFDEARRSGKNIRYQGTLPDPVASGDEYNSLNKFDGFSYVLWELSNIMTDEELNRAIDSKVWEIQK
ncbi:MAG: hypothetical protein ACRC1P_09520 [Cellulosilyticaceae bacterium]